MSRNRTAALGSGLLVAVIAVGLAGAGHSTPAVSEAPAESIRIGTYDSRAIAIAYVRSGFDEVISEKKADYAAAKAAGDTDTVAELEKWGNTHQRLLHFQGFGRYPVDGMLAAVRGELPRVAEEFDLDAIVWLPSYTGEGVEVVDVTELLVRLFTQDEQVATMAMAACEHEPLTFEVLIDMDPMD